MYTDTLQLVQSSAVAITTPSVWGGMSPSIVPDRAQIVEWGFFCRIGGVYTGTFQVALQTAPNVATGAVFTTQATITNPSTPAGALTLVAGTRYVSGNVKTFPIVLLPGQQYQVTTLTAATTGAGQALGFVIIKHEGFVATTPLNVSANLNSPLVIVSS